MKIGLSSLLFVRDSVEEAVRISGELEYDAIEIIYDIPHFMPDHDPSDVVALKKLVKDYDLDVSVHATFWDLNPASHYPELLKLTLKQVKKSIRVCDILGGEIVVLHPGRCHVPEMKEIWKISERRYLNFLDECLDYATRNDIKLALENGGRDDDPYSSLDELKTLIPKLEGAGIALDVAHAYLRDKKTMRNPELSIAKIIEELGAQIIHLHLHDNHGKRDEHLILGDGNIDFKPVIDALKKIGYDKLAIAELWNPEKPFETAQKGLTNCKKLLAR